MKNSNENTIRNHYITKNQKKSITIIVPAYNEEENLENAVKKYDKIVKKYFSDYEILIFNDGSKDKTGKIADSIAKKNPKIRVIHNRGNKGLGYNYRTGVKLAKKDYITMLSGEGDALAESVNRLLSNAGKADIVLSYISNSNVRQRYRQVLSNSFTNILNILFGLKVKYYNGYVVHKASILKKVKMNTNSFAYQAEILVRLLKNKNKYSLMQIPYKTERTVGSSMFRIKNLIGIGTTVLRLLFDIYIKRDF